jgi:2-amino-4-hydroxy-6-hydroxymethyldihydropteridine diphosphokinase
MTSAQPVTAYVGLGANVGDPLRQIDAAVTEIGQLPQTQLVSRSSFYRSAPVGPVAQPDFVNAVCAIRTELAALELLRLLLEIEQRHGRVRGALQNGPRTLDLDLLLYGTEEIHAPELTLPHPRMHERAFVLTPLAEIAPQLEIPGHGPVSALLNACAGQRVERLG